MCIRDRCGTFLCYMLVVVGQKTLRPTVAGMYNYVQPVVACVVAVCWNMDSFNLTKVIAVVLIFGGVYLVKMCIRDSCYLDGITLEDCTFDPACDRAFEDSSNIDAQIRGAIAEVKNPISGHIVADAIGRITYDAFAKGRDCVIETRKDS